MTTMFSSNILKDYDSNKLAGVPTDYADDMPDGKYYVFLDNPHDPKKKIYPIAEYNKKGNDKSYNIPEWIKIKDDKDITIEVDLEAKFFYGVGEEGREEGEGEIETDDNQANSNSKFNLFKSSRKEDEEDEEDDDEESIGEEEEEVTDDGFF